MQMNQLRKSTKISAYWRLLIKLAVFFAVVTLLIVQLKDVKWSDITGVDFLEVWALIASLLLLFVNQYFEYAKWRVAARSIDANPKMILRAYWSGVGSAFLTPNGWGSFLGRMIHFSKRERLLIIAASMQANYSQLIPTLIFGVIGLFFLEFYPVQVGVFSIAATGFVLIFYFTWPLFLPKHKSRNKWLRRLQRLQPFLVSFQYSMLGYSLLRFFVFSLQFVLLFVSLGYTEFQTLFFGVWLVYLLTSFVPSLWSGKVLIRETAALYVFTKLGVAIPDILFASLLIWLINIVLPAAFSTFVWIPRKEKENVVR
jgi:hypothetical protein